VWLVTVEHERAAGEFPEPHIVMSLRMGSWCYAFAMKLSIDETRVHFP